MPNSPNKLSQFWQELKRRKVLRVITVYAAVAFVILQLVEILAPSLRLPDWTMNLILVLLIVGFIITVIVSWVYDATPEGIVKTEPAHKVKKEDISVSSKGWKIASYISFIVIVALIILNIIPRTNRSDIQEVLDKSIAVLPFINDSEDKGNEHIINGIMEEILINLQSIKDLRVPGRTSVEQYRNNPKPIPEIAGELNVAYIIEGSGQKYGNKIRLRVQLVETATDKHLWADSYDEEINGPEDIFRIQSKIAKSIAAELQAVITPEEKQIIEKIPTTSLTAYDFYQRGREEYYKYWLDYNNIEALERAENLYHKALEYDSAFAQAYTGLAWVYSHKDYWETVLTENFLDSMLILADIALSFDDQLSESYVIRGEYYRNHNQKEQALTEYDKAIKLNPNEWMAYWHKGLLYYTDDIVKCIDNCHKAVSLQRGTFLPFILRRLRIAYAEAGFIEKSNYYLQEALKLDFDSVEYYRYLGSSENDKEKSIEFYKEAYAIDSNDFLILNRLGEDYMFLGQYEEALKYVRRKYEMQKDQGFSGNLSLNYMGYLYWQIGYKEEAEYYFNEAINSCNRMIELGRGGWDAAFAHLTLATVSAFLGDKDKAFENLRIFNQRQIMFYWMPNYLKNIPLFDNIRDEPEFQQIVNDVEAKSQAEHERVRIWLEENEML